MQKMRLIPTLVLFFCDQYFLRLSKYKIVVFFPLLRPAIYLYSLSKLLASALSASACDWLSWVDISFQSKNDSLKQSNTVRQIAL